MLENLGLLAGLGSISVVSLVTIWPATHPGNVFDHACFTMTTYKSILLGPYNHMWPPAAMAEWWITSLAGASCLSLRD